ncbi:hypothetical protein BaRGS_00014549 [Batillaria attramentaria]|uniref:Uncharacterized protein n=1 Tax=Batillaria attramentaria TaxID=370345 RepID=A0ABD0L4D6_9CAEN
MWSDVIEELSEVLEQTTETVREVSPSFTDPNVTNRRAVLKQTRDRASRFSSQFGESVKQFIAHSEVTKSVEQYKIITSEPPVQVEIHALERTFVDDKGTDETTRHSTPSSPVGASPPQIAKSKSRPPSVSPAPDPLCPRQRSAPATAGRVAEEKQESQEEPTSASASASPKPKSRKKSASPPASPSARSPPTMSPEAKTREKESPRRLKTPVTARRQGVRADGTTVVSPDQGKHEDEVSEQLMALHGADISSYQAAVDSLVPPSLSLSSSLNPQSEASAETAVGSSEVSTQQPGTRSPEAAPRQRRRSPSSARSADGSVKSPSSRESSSRCDRSPSPTKRHSPQHRGGSSTSPSPQRSAVSSVSPAPSARSPVVESVASARSSPRHSVKSLTPPAVSTQLGGKSVVSSSLSPRSSPQHSAKSSPSPFASFVTTRSSLSPPSSPQHSGKSSPSPSTQRLSVTPESPKRSPRQSPKIVTARSQTPHFSPCTVSDSRVTAAESEECGCPVTITSLITSRDSNFGFTKTVTTAESKERGCFVTLTPFTTSTGSNFEVTEAVTTAESNVRGYPIASTSFIQAQTPSQADDTKSGTTRSPSLERGVSAMQSPSPRMPRSSPPQGPRQ